MAASSAAVDYITRGISGCLLGGEVVLLWISLLVAASCAAGEISGCLLCCCRLVY